MSRKIAFGGVFSALTIIMVYLGGSLPSGKLALYAISSIPAAFALVQSGPAAAVSVYAVSAFLSYILLGNISVVLPYVLFFGYYGLAKYYIERTQNAVLEIILKLVVFNTALSISYFVYTRLIAASIAFEAFIIPAIVIPVAGLLLQFGFLAYDYVFSRILALYQDRFKNQLL